MPTFPQKQSSAPGRRDCGPAHRSRECRYRRPISERRCRPSAQTRRIYADPRAIRHDEPRPVFRLWPSPIAVRAHGAARNRWSAHGHHGRFQQPAPRSPWNPARPKAAPRRGPSHDRLQMSSCAMPLGRFSGDGNLQLQAPVRRASAENSNGLPSAIP